jgi:hypothetical protein
MEAIRFPSEDDWEALLAEANREGDEVTLLTDYAEKIGAVLPGWWSVDFMLGADGVWYFIDAAEGEKSWHPECEFAPERPGEPEYESPLAGGEDAAP